MAIDAPAIAANLHRLTYQRKIWGATLSPDSLEQGCPLDIGRHDTQGSTSHPPPDLGNLEQLPQELIDSVLLDLDLLSLTTIRAVNRRARAAVDALWQYRDIVTHAIGSLRAALSLNVASWISCRALHWELCATTCVNCDHFGAMLYLTSCSRVCYVCLNDDPRFLPLKPLNARHTFGLGSRELASLPTARSIPGRYSFGMQFRGGRSSWVDPSAAREAEIQLHGSAEHMERFVSKSHEERSRSFAVKVDNNKRMRLPRPRAPPCLHPPRDRGELNPDRFVCVVAFPWLDRSHSRVEWGYSCKGCRNSRREKTDGRLDWRWLYLSKDYPRHLEQCELAQDYFESIQRPGTYS